MMPLAETKHPKQGTPSGIAVERHERGPCLLPEQHHGAQVARLVAAEQAVEVGDPLGGLPHAFALERLDVYLARELRLDDPLLEGRDETRHAARVGIVGGDDQDSSLLLVFRTLGGARRRGGQQPDAGECQEASGAGNQTENTHRSICNRYLNKDTTFFLSVLVFSSIFDPLPALPCLSDDYRASCPRAGWRRSAVTTMRWSLTRSRSVR